MIVLDTSFLIGFYNLNDRHHAAAQAWMDRFLAGEWGKGLLLEYVFLEVVTVLLLRRDLATAMRVGGLLRQAEELEFVPCSELFPAVWNTFARQSGTKLSFTDAAIITLAQQRTGGWILTFDEEFRKVSGLRIADRL